MLKDQIEILLVEDDPEDLELTMRALCEEHVCNRIHVARDGEEALDFLFCRGEHSKRNPDAHLKLILLDLKLPKVDGLEVLEQVKNDPRTRAVPVVILTSSKQEQDMIRGYNLGANSYIQKPVDFDQFQATIKQLGYYWLLVNQPPPLERLNDKPIATSTFPAARQQDGDTSSLRALGKVQSNAAWPAPPKPVSKSSE